MTLGSAAATDWLRARELSSSTEWFVEVALDVIDAPARQVWSGVTDSRFHIHIYPQEWGFLFCHGSRASWIRVGERAFVHGRDDYELVGVVPLLRDLGPFVRMLEQRHRMTFRREHALIRSNLPGSDEAVRGWLSTL